MFIDLPVNPVWQLQHQHAYGTLQIQPAKRQSNKKCKKRRSWMNVKICDMQCGLFHNLWWCISDASEWYTVKHRNEFMDFLQKTEHLSFLEVVLRSYYNRITQLSIYNMFWYLFRIFCRKKSSVFIPLQNVTEAWMPWCHL